MYQIWAWLSLPDGQYYARSASSSVAKEYRLLTTEHVERTLV
jgi:hypothetical protein